MTPVTLAEIAGLALLACVGHLASLLVGIADQSGRRDRGFGVMILFILLCSPVFFDNRPHDFAMMSFAVGVYLIAISIIERRLAKSPLIFRLLGFAIALSCVFTLAALEYLATHLPLASMPLSYAGMLISRNVVLFLLLTRGAYFAYAQKHLRLTAALYVVILIGAPFMTDFALAACGPLLALGCWILGSDLRKLKKRMTL